MDSFFIKQRAWLWPLIAFAILTPFTPFLDLEISRYFYHKPEGFSSNAFYKFMFYYGPYPAILTFVIALGMLICALVKPKFSAWKKPALCLCLTYVIGAGLLTHVVFKEQWGRPRPKQTVEFGGKQTFRPYYEPFFFNPEKSKSFPSGHATMGFYFFSLMLVGKRIGSRALFWTGVGLTTVLGFLLSLTRIAQGGHFFSDITVSALLMWLTAYFIDKWIYAKNKE